VESIKNIKKGIKMKFQILSDLHLEFVKNDEEKLLKNMKTNADCVLLAGDILTLYNIEKIFKIISDVFYNQDVFIIAGNHEYYGFFVNNANDILYKEAKKYKNITFLNNDVFEYNNHVILGTCGWWDNFNKNGYLRMNDFVYIKDLTLDRYQGLEFCDEAKKFLIDNLKKYQNKKIIVMTHNAPLFDFVPYMYINSSLNPFFANNWDYIIKKYNIDLWVSGHLHQSKMFSKYNTLFVENSFGYYNKDQNLNFDNNLVLEI
jgi:predicted phosphohydrolase